MIMEYGLGGKAGKNRYYDEFDMNAGTGDNADEISEEVDKVLDEAYKLANEYLTENRDYLDAIALALVDHQILMKDELDKIWESVTAKRRKAGTKSRSNNQKKVVETSKFKLSDKFKKGKKAVKRIKKEVAKMFK